ncbi:MAG: UvrD-helicase domain-containing protein [Bacilli bacterium]|nr:UvrD-helicase domain-containing protein [Bacilli bacterium]
MPNWTNDQRKAIDLDNSNIIVSAGAGSGKTEVLSERVIRKLKSGVHINELLILTFTNAAARGMKNRIRKKIKKENLLEELKYIDTAYITTFDSYALSLLKKYHYILNVDKNLKIADSDIINYKKEEILDELFDSYYESNNKEFIKLISDFCTKDDTEIKKAVLNISNKLDLNIDLDNYLDSYMDNYFSDNYLDSVIDKLLDNIKGKIEVIKDLINSLSYYVDSKYLEKINSSVSMLLISSSYEDIKNNSNVSLPRLVTDYEEAKIYKQAIKEEIDGIKALCSYENTGEIKNEILKAKDYVSGIITIVRDLNTRLNKFKFENDIYEFSDVAKLSIKLLKEHEDIREEIKNSLNEIMVDEYQDTNDIQEEFISLISDNNVYMVGDIKQSIYRFRNANPYIFKNKYDRYKNNDGGIKIDLKENFRSREETVKNINKVFDLIMDDIIGGADYKYSHEMVFGNKSYNEEGKVDQNSNFEIYDYDYDKESGFTKEEYEIFIIANDIKEKINNKYKVFDRDLGGVRPCEYKDFVILLDRSNSFNLYKKIFEYNNIPLSILKDEKLNDEVILLLIKNFFITISKINKNEIDNDFKHAFVSILRSFIFEYTDQEIFDLFLNNSFRQNDIFKKLKSIDIDSMTSKDLITYIIEKFNIIESLVKIGNVENSMATIEYLYNYIDTKEELGFTIDDFSNYLEDIIENNYEIKYSNNKTIENAVKIMTIHKSKGLEYSICYYGSLYNKFNLRDTQDRFLYDNNYGIITPYFDEGISDTIYKYLIKEETIKEEISEKIRLFYVALTRAKEKMILLGDLDKEIYSSKDSNGVIDNVTRSNYRSFLDMILSVQKELKEYITNIENVSMTKDYEKNRNINLSDIVKENSTKIKVNEISKNKVLVEENKYSKTQNKILTIEEINNMKYGTDIHHIFEVEDFEATTNEKVKKFLEVYNKKPGKTYKEYEFAYEKDGKFYHGIIDLMFEYESFIDIIDYKLSDIEDEAYIKQLNGYKEYINNKTNKEVNIYLYSILNNELKKI